MALRTFRTLTLLLALAVLAGCATPKSYDYAAFRHSRPASILVLPPLNNSPDVLASNSLYAQVTLPLAESGYYVFPAGLVNETFRQNGLSNPPEIHAIPTEKLRSIFGADAVLYITVSDYGTEYRVVSSESRVTARARLVDLRSGQSLWSGAATASSAEGRRSSGGLVGMLAMALVHQIIDSTRNQSHTVAGVTASRLLTAGQKNGLLYGPRSPRYEQEQKPR